MKKLKKIFRRNFKKMLSLALVVMTVCMLSVVCFAAEGDTALTAEMLEPVLEGAKANIGVIVPVAIGLFVIVLGISFIPMIFKKFKHG